MLIGDFHQMPVHAYRARIIRMYDDPGVYAPSYHRLCLCKCGSGDFYDENGVPHTVHAGDLFWYAPGAPRRWRVRSERPWIVSYITFGGSAKKDGLPGFLGLDFESRVIRIEDVATRKIEMLLYKAAVQYSEDTEAGNVIMHSILYAILCELSLALRGEKHKADSISYDFSGVLSYIRKHLKEDLSIDRICSETGMSRGGLFSAFRRELGVSPNEFITESRLDKAAALLIQNSEMSVHEAAIEVGISGAGYFSKLFKRRFGTTPGEYRNGGGIRTDNSEKKLPVYLINAGDTYDAAVSYAGISDQNSYQLMYCVEGRGIFTDDNGNAHTVTPGMICFLSPDSEASYEPLDSMWHIIWLRFGGKRMSGFTRYLGFGKSNVIANSRDFKLEYLYKPLIYLEKEGYDFEAAFYELYKNA